MKKLAAVLCLLISFGVARAQTITASTSSAAPNDSAGSTSLPINTIVSGSQNVTVYLTARGARFTAGSPGSPAFLLNSLDGTGSIVSQSVQDSRHAQVVINAPTSSTTFGITENIAPAETGIMYTRTPLYLTYAYANQHTDTAGPNGTQANPSTLYSNAYFIPANQTLAVTANAVGATYTSSTPFAISGCSTATLTGITVVSPTMATLTINPGAVECTITVSDGTNTAPLPVYLPRTITVDGNGGTVYTKNLTDGQCNGLNPQSYAAAKAAAGGATTNLPCALNDWRRVSDTGGTYGKQEAIWRPGDTIVLTTNYYDAFGKPGEVPGWRVGFDYQSGSTLRPFCWGGNGHRFCVNSDFPPGIPAQHTRLLGQNYASCNVGNAPDPSKLTDIFGGQMDFATLNLGNAQWLDVQCIRLDRRSGCAMWGNTPTTLLPHCQDGTAPFDDTADDGIRTNSNTENVLLQDVVIEGFPTRGIKGDFGLGTISSRRVQIKFNGFTGWDLDVGDGNAIDNIIPNINPLGQYQSPAWDAQYLVILGSGITEEFPVVHQFPAAMAVGQSNSGQGDGTGSANNGQETDVYMDHVLLAYNTQDGEDFGHVFGSDPHVFKTTNSASWGNNGGQWKWGGGFTSVTFENNVGLGNCYRMNDPIADAPSSYNTDLNDFCRANATMSFNIQGGTQVNFSNNTIAGYAGSMIDLQCAPSGDEAPNCVGSKFVTRNNNFVAYTTSKYDLNNGHGLPAMWCNYDCNGTGHDQMSDTYDGANNIYYNFRVCQANQPVYGFQHSTAVNEQCTDPQLQNEPTPAQVKVAESSLDNFVFGLSSTSPSISAGVPIAGLSLDLAGKAYANPPSIGALEKGSQYVVPVVISSAPSLAVTYGTKGVQTIAYGGVTLEDVGANSGDQFHIYHMVTEDLQGNITAGWGETNNGEAWNASTNIETYTYAWGTIAVQHVVSGSNLNMNVTVTNNAGSGVVFDGAEIYPFALGFPNDPFAGYSQFVATTQNPGISVADYGSGVATVVAPSASQPLFTGWKGAGRTGAYSPLMVTTLPDGAATFAPNDIAMKLQPGQTATYTVSVRFTPEGAAADISDAAANYRSVYPYQVNWTDHRPIGTIYLGSNVQNTGKNQNSPSGCGASSGNPRNFKSSDGTVNCTNSTTNSVAFQDVILKTAQACVANAATLGAQGCLTWDVEGDEYAQTTSYVCSPDRVATVAPEMEQTVTDPAFPTYNGMKLDDAYFAIQTKAGLRVGNCLRPNVFMLNNDGSATQGFPTRSAAGDQATAQLLIAKADAANKRWGSTLFYVDSMVYAPADGNGVMNSNVLQMVSTARPQYLFMPESQYGQVEVRNYAYSAQFFNFEDNANSAGVPDLGTPYDTPGYSVYSIYPKAFGANLLNDVAASKINTYTPQLTNAAAHGDILMGHADYDDEPNNQDIAAIYKAGGFQSSNPIAAVIKFVVRGLRGIRGCKGCHLSGH